MTLLRIVIAPLAAGALSTARTATTLGLGATWLPRSVWFAVGALAAYVALADMPQALAYVLAIFATTQLVLEP
ncbi:MAG: hypothetical protein KGR23_07945 [Betaproteobacteria bacterium]|nr:hypothetical protein [Betaproteobacteria bacterium]